jgi:hypothetical protein
MLVVLVPPAAVVLLVLWAARRLPRRWARLAVAVPVLVLVAAGADGAYEVWRAGADGRALGVCGLHMGQLGIALRRYETDHGRLPDANAWVDELYPYVKDWRIFRDPADPSRGRSSYGMNSNLSHKRSQDIANPENTVLLYESRRAGRNPAGAGARVAAQGRHRPPPVMDQGQTRLLSVRRPKLALPREGRTACATMVIVCVLRENGTKRLLKKGPRPPRDRGLTLSKVVRQARFWCFATPPLSPI